jgi:hypothetical protein
LLISVRFEMGDHNSIDALILWHNTRQPVRNQIRQHQKGGGEWLQKNLQAAGNMARRRRSASRARCDGGKKEHSNPAEAEGS